MYAGPDRRQFERLDFVTPLAYKVCSKDTISKLLQGYTSNLSQAGLMCSIKERVNKDDILWLSFDRGILHICEDMERRSLIYQNGIIGKVVRIDPVRKNAYTVGIKFLTREEKDLGGIYGGARFFHNSRENDKE